MLNKTQWLSIIEYSQVYNLFSNCSNYKLVMGMLSSPPFNFPPISPSHLKELGHMALAFAYI